MKTSKFIAITGNSGVGKSTFIKFVFDNQLLPCVIGVRFSSAPESRPDDDPNEISRVSNSVFEKNEIDFFTTKEINVKNIGKIRTSNGFKKEILEASIKNSPFVLLNASNTIVEQIKTHFKNKIIRILITSDHSLERIKNNEYRKSNLLHQLNRNNKSQYNYVINNSFSKQRFFSDIALVVSDIAKQSSAEVGGFEFQNESPHTCYLNPS